MDRQNPTPPGTDLGYRLWDVAKRRQPPVPSEPLPEPKEKEPPARGSR
jgi:hypothetical protein